MFQQNFSETSTCLCGWWSTTKLGNNVSPVHVCRTSSKTHLGKCWSRAPSSAEILWPVCVLITPGLFQSRTFERFLNLKACLKSNFPPSLQFMFLAHLKVDCWHHTFCIWMFSSLCLHSFIQLFSEHLLRSSTYYVLCINERNKIRFYVLATVPQLRAVGRPSLASFLATSTVQTHCDTPETTESTEGCRKPT